VSKVKALFFDVGGTVFDWKSTVKEKVQEVTQEKGITLDVEAFANDWRLEMMKVLTQVRHGNLPWINSDGMHLRALENLVDRYRLLKSIDRMSLVISTWHHLKVFNGAVEAVTRLRNKYTVVVLTILSWQSILSSSKAANVQWDGILSCEFLGYYKPSLQAYLKATELLGLKPSESMMVAAHKGDLAASQAAGMHTAYVDVPEKDNVSEGFGQPHNTHFDIEANNFEELCSKLEV